MVSDINFGLTAGGQHVMHGVRVGENESRHRSGDMPNANRGQSSEDISKQHGMHLIERVNRRVNVIIGRRYIHQIGQSLNMSNLLQEHGERFYGLAVGYGFTRGRRIKNVAAVSLYIACRFQSEQNTHMLIDFSDVLDVSAKVVVLFRSGESNSASR